MRKKCSQKIWSRSCYVARYVYGKKRFCFFLSNGRWGILLTTTMRAAVTKAFDVDSWGHTEFLPQEQGIKNQYRT